jgi:hypothetical protein
MQWALQMFWQRLYHNHTKKLQTIEQFAILFLEFHQIIQIILFTYSSQYIQLRIYNKSTPTWLLMYKKFKTIFENDSSINK